MSRCRVGACVSLWFSIALFCAGGVACGCADADDDDTSLRIGSKKFTESVVLAEMLRGLAADAAADGDAGDLEVEHARELGGTRVLWEALRAGDIDAYPEYTGTIAEEILAGRDDVALAGRDRAAQLAAMRDALAADDIAMSEPLGFDNTYALGMREPVAERLGIETIGDLKDHPELELGFSSEFMDREDGWPGLQAAYGLPHVDVRSMDHDLAYRGLDEGSIAVTDLYSTDAEIAAYDLRVLDDDLGYFPRYEAVILYRASLEERAPRVIERWRRLEGRIDAATMQDANRRARIDRVPEGRVAADVLAAELGIQVSVEVETRWDRLWRNTLDHLWLVGISLMAAIVVALPLGVLAARRRELGRGVLGVVGILQTIPSLALLVALVPLVGIGAWPAIIALFLYSLLPIVQNTHAGLVGIDPAVVESARALGLPPLARLRLVLLPLAMPTILAGIKTAAVINVGTATLGALIGAGGYGQPILTGIRLADTALILEGAIPAALLALAAQGGFGLVERWVVPRGLRLANG